MTSHARLVYKPAGLLMFRWQGDYTMMTTGPVASGVSEPLPLPTTVIGAALGTKEGARLDEDSVLEALSERLGCRVAALRGPYYPGKDRIAVHVYPFSLAVISMDARLESIIEVKPASAAGTALRRDRKSVATGHLYRAKLLDPLTLNEKHGLDPLIATDLLVSQGACNPRTLGTVKLGGEARVASAYLDDNPTLVKLVESTGDTSYCIAATPVLLEPEQAKRLARGEPISIGDACRLEPVTQREAAKIAGEANAKKLRLRIEILSPGVDGATGFPREPHPAIYPGSLLKCECSRDTLLKGLGLLARLGFGTLIPLKPRRQ